MDRVDAAVADLLQLLELAGVLLAVVVVMGILVGLIRSLFQVALGRSTLVMPFAGGAEVAWVSDVLVQQLDCVETAVLERHQAIRNEARSNNTSPQLALGPAARFLPERPLDEHLESFVAEHPISGQAFGPISLLGVTFSPG
jgi:hypothetical protein